MLLRLPLNLQLWTLRAPKNYRARFQAKRIFVCVGKNLLIWLLIPSKVQVEFKQMRLWNDRGQLYGCRDMRKVVSVRKSTPYQLSRTPCNKECNPVFHKKQTECIHIQMDKIAALSDLLKIGGTKNKTLIKISKEIWSYLITNRITITAKSLSGQNGQNISLVTARALQSACYKRPCFFKFATS